MRSICIAPIVEGYGEVGAVPVLLRRIGIELLSGTNCNVLHPIRTRRSKLIPNRERGMQLRLNENEIRRAVVLARNKLLEKTNPPAPTLILMLLDADEDCPGILAPMLESEMRKAIGSAQDVACVLAKSEFESWFVAAADSLVVKRELRLLGDETIPCRPEETGQGKSWIEARFQRSKYSEPTDQPRLAAKMDLNAISAEKSPSFDKLVRELRKRITVGS